MDIKHLEMESPHFGMEELLNFPSSQSVMAVTLCLFSPTDYLWGHCSLLSQCLLLHTEDNGDEFCSLGWQAKATQSRAGVP